MRRPIRRLTILTAGLVVLTVSATIVWLGPLPPRVLVMSTGAPGSDYAILAERYRDILRRSGVELRLLPSAGGEENVRRLKDPNSGVSVGFAQGGLISEHSAPDLRSLGTLFLEPFWFFSRVPLRPQIQDLRGKKIALGLPGSGTRALAIQLLRLNDIDEQTLDMQSMPPSQASEALLKGRIDAAGILSSWDSAEIHRLLASSDVDIIGL